MPTACPLCGRRLRDEHPCPSLDCDRVFCSDACLTRHCKQTGHVDFRQEYGEPAPTPSGFRPTSLMVVGGILGGVALMAILVLIVILFSAGEQGPTQASKKTASTPAAKAPSPTMTPHTYDEPSAGDVVLGAGGMLCVVVGIGLGAIFGLVAWSLPIVVAIIRKHPSVAAIAVIDIFLGWTLVGYAVALAWALTAIDSDKRYR